MIEFLGLFILFVGMGALFFVLDDASRPYPLLNRHIPWVLTGCAGILLGLYLL